MIPRVAVPDTQMYSDDDDSLDLDPTLAPTAAYFDSDESDSELDAIPPSEEEDAAEASLQDQKGAKFIDRAENDPKRGPVDVVCPSEDEHGWTRHLTRVRRRTFRGDQPYGPTFDADQQTRPLDYFAAFFPLSLFDEIADWTNMKLREKGETTMTSVAEIRAWFGIHVLMGLSNLSNSRDYWSTHPGYRNQLIGKTMSRHRFETLSGSLSCADPTTDPKRWRAETQEEKERKFNYIRKHPLDRVQSAWDTVQQSCREKYNCLPQITLDEAMVPYKGYLGWLTNHRMPTKPIKQGFRMYALCESETGYMCNFQAYAPSKKPRQMLDIALEATSSHHNKFHNIYCDRMYTSPAFARSLLERDTYVTGAVNERSKGLATDFSKDRRKNPRADVIFNLHRAPRGTFYVRQNGRLTYTLWKDLKVVTILSSAHSGYRDADDPETVTRRYRLKKGDKKQSHTVAAPPVVVDYNKYRNGVDRADQLRAYHSCWRKSQHWWKQVLYFLIDISRVNAWISYNHVHNSAANPAAGRIKRHSQFVLALADQLIDGYGKVPRQNPQLAGNLNPPPVQSHRLVDMRHKSPKVCQRCLSLGLKTAAGYAKRSKFGCRVCDVHLCKVPCFLLYHRMVAPQ